ncbi:discoidin, CUB and LCCL domain-containing protein 1-like [Hydractinia symbiolongicarpus]|uniref:discoidin, CUB and LCCL domain-containing protein 1-like n=1 Tax=Hydractinia symbiolongicarpus TaxID=13093 RepID=UPI0025508628|nr:discoidin, CUB and LCCL domain-containing protein 1-like [Hydractinia symbiolongicarpus]
MAFMLPFPLKYGGHKVPSSDRVVEMTKNLKISLSDKNRFKDSQFSSSSTRRGPKYGYYTPNNARLSTRKSQNSGGGWCGSPRNPHTDWIEIDLGRMHRIDKIGTKGLNGGNTWVKSYELKYSNGGELKSYLSLDQTHPKEFPGNTDTDSLVINKLESGIYARKVRIIPKTSKFETCMRFELYGCDFIGNNKQ